MTRREAFALTFTSRGNPLVDWCRKTTSGRATMKLPHRRQFLHLAAGAASFPTLSRMACAQAYPIRPITFVNSAAVGGPIDVVARVMGEDRKSTRLNSSHSQISYAVFCL